MLIHSPSGGIMLSQNESTYVLSSSSWQRISWSRRGLARTSNSSFDGIGSLSRTISSSELSKQGKPGSLFHGIPDFAEV